MLKYAVIQDISQEVTAILLKMVMKRELYSMVTLVWYHIRVSSCPLIKEHHFVKMLLKERDLRELNWTGQKFAAFSIGPYA